jgi:hypothetical protein
MYGISVMSPTRLDLFVATTSTVTGRILIFLTSRGYLLRYVLAQQGWGSLTLLLHVPPPRIASTDYLERSTRRETKTYQTGA